MHRDISLFRLPWHGDERLSFFFLFCQPTRPSYSSFLLVARIEVEFSTFIHTSCWFVSLNLACYPLCLANRYEKWNNYCVVTEKKETKQITTMSHSLKKKKMVPIGLKRRAVIALACSDEFNGTKLSSNSSFCCLIEERVALHRGSVLSEADMRVISCD